MHVGIKQEKKSVHSRQQNIELLQMSQNKICLTTYPLQQCTAKKVWPQNTNLFFFFGRGGESEEGTVSERSQCSVTCVEKDEAQILKDSRVLSIQSYTTARVHFKYLSSNTTSCSLTNAQIPC